MKPRIRWKLLGSYLLVILVMGAVIYGWLSRTQEALLTDEITRGLLSEARLARLTAMREIADLRKDSPAMASAIARETHARVTFITLPGEVVGDSDVRPEQLGELENHANRPEIQAALASGQGSSVRYSATLQTPMLYVAFPFADTSGERGVLRLALPLSALKATRVAFREALGVSLLIAAVISLLLSYLLSNVTSRTLRAMAAAAAQIGRGEYSRRFPVRGRDEVGELGHVMNEMAGKIESQLTTLARERNRLDTILSGMGEGVMVTDAAGIVTLVNPAFRHLLAVHEEIEGKPLIEITRHPALHESFRAVLATRAERTEEVVLQVPGEKVILIHWVPLMDRDDVAGVVAVFHDISDLKRLEIVRRDFVANVSHELRTPVTVIKGYAETLLSGAVASDPERAERFLGVIHAHAERLANLIGDLLSISEIESGKLSLEMAPIRIDALARRAEKLLEQQSRAKGIRIEIGSLADAPPVLADPGRIEQVLLNLLDNALKYTPEKGVVTISARDEGEMVAISVADTGIGIPPKDLTRVFERFYRVDEGRSREQGGTGLGLSIVKHLVQLHGGTVGVESTPGKGSVFTVTLRKATDSR